MNNIEHDCHPIALYVGIDWADEENVYQSQDEGSKERKRGTIKQTAEDLTEWIMAARQKIPVASRIAIALEQSRGGLIHFLQQFDFLILYLINPKSLAKFREVFRPSGPKDDPDDSGCLLDLVVYHREKLHAWQPDNEETRKLSTLCELRRKLVDQRSSIVNTMISYLKFFFPQALNWIGDLTTPMACDFLKKWPTLQAIKHARQGTVGKFYRTHHSRNEEKIQQRIAEIQKAVPITSDPAIIDPYSVAVVNYARIVAELNRMIDGYDKQIENLFAQHPDRDLFASLPGAGAVMAPRLLTAIGSDRNRYQSAVEIQRYSGIAPVTRKSGQFKGVSRRLGRPKFICQSWLEFAAHSVGFSPWANAFYHHQRSLGKGRYAALRSLAYKWIRIIFRCWKLHQPYNEHIYLNSLSKRNSPLATLLKNA